jgi:hypothetical protein
MEEKRKNMLFGVRALLLICLYLLLQNTSFNSTSSFINGIKGNLFILVIIVCMMLLFWVIEVLLDKDWQKRFRKFAKKNGLTYTSKPDLTSTQILNTFGITDTNEITDIFIGEWKDIPMVVFHGNVFGGFYSHNTYEELYISALVDLGKVPMKNYYVLLPEEKSILDKENSLGSVIVKNNQLLFKRERKFTSSYLTPKDIASFMDETVRIVMIVKKNGDRTQTS